MVTMKKIAELCGVSRGTVDRALNGRGRVNMETAENIREVARQLGYEPNPAGTAVELYATTLHYAPCGVDDREFRCGVVLPRLTNESLVAASSAAGEDRLLFAVNKWLIAHKDSGLEADGAWIGLKGENITLA